MNLLFECVELGASFAEIFILYQICNIIMFEHRRVKNKVTDIWLTLMGACIILACNHITLFSYYTTLIAFIFLFLSVSIVYRINKVIVFATVSFYLLCLCCFDVLIITAISSAFNGNKTMQVVITNMGFPRMGMMIVIKSLWILLYCYIKKYLYWIKLNKSDAYVMVGIACGGFLGFIFLVDQTLSLFQHGIVGMWFLLFVLLILLGIVLYFVMRNREEKLKTEFYEMRSALLEKNYAAINEVYSDNARLYHDLNNHLNVLYQMLEEKDIEEAQKYIKEISKPIINLSKTVWTGIDVVDFVLNSKIELMGEKNITYDINVEFPENTGVQSQDICIILANLLDNAIEAVEQIENTRNIYVTIRKINYFLILKITNTCSMNEIFSSNYPSTSKENKVMHGWGLPSVEKVVKKYNGTLKCKCENDKFIATVLLFFNK